jgi:hypothetical protein
VRIRTASDVRVARGRGLRMYLLTDAVPTRLHYPIRFPPVLMTDAPLAPLVDADFRQVPFRQAEELDEPSLEACATMLLHVDEIAARQVVRRNPGLDPGRLAALVLGEGLMRPATAVRLREFAPLIPVVGRELPISAVHAQDRKNPG